MKVVSYSLWGFNDIFYYGVIRNCELIRSLLPSYKIVVYIDSHYDFDRIKEIEKLGVEIVLIESLGRYHGMYWRFFACQKYDLVLVRDLDSRITPREVELVNEWEESNKKFHIIRDHFHHNQPIMGGMWGCKGKMENITDLINTHGEFLRYGDDQLFLSSYIFPMAKTDCLEHTSNGLHFTDNYKVIDKSEDGSFIGERIDINENPLVPVDRLLTK